MLLVIFLCMTLVWGGGSWEAPLVGLSASRIVKDEYLVTVREMSAFKEAVQKYEGLVVIEKEFHIGNWNAALITADVSAVKVMREDPNVELMEANHKAGIYDGYVGKDGQFPTKVSGETDQKVHMFHDRKADQDEYIVRVKGGTQEMEFLRNEVRASILSAGHSMEIRKELHVKDWQGLVVEMDTETADILRSNPNVAYVERNQPVKMFSTTTDNTILPKSTDETLTTMTTEVPCQQQSTGAQLWGLSRINNHDPPGNYSSAVYEYSHNDDGQGVDVYIVDSGVFLEHEEFEGRAIWGMTATGVSNEGDRDLDGHGTHVASTAAGKTYGVAKKATITAVKVLDHKGEGYISDIVEGIEWTVDKIKNKKKEGRSVLNLSLGGPIISTTLESAVQNAIDAGVTIVIAAGNDAKDACGTTPGRASGAIVVGASDSVDNLVFFSNFGPCVDIAAPGLYILGAFITNTTMALNSHGTSMSAPHVAGIVARYLSSLPINVNPSPSEVRQHILDTSSKGYLKFNETKFRSTPNRLLYTSCGSTGQDPTPSADPLEVCHRHQTKRDRWSLTRISSKESPANYEEGEYHYGVNDDGKGVDIYVLDTGVYLDHTDFEGRASWGYTASDLRLEGNSDLQGHGTHVASLAAGKTYGTAKAANIISVKVLDRYGLGNGAGVIEGLKWVSTQVENKKNNVVRPKGSVVNLSLGLSGALYSLEEVIQTMVQDGITFVAAAGNEKEDACSISPARMSSVITVGATNIYDDLASFSNYGSCVDILAPGQSILGASNKGPGLSDYSSGTSQAAPHVAGVVARYMSSFRDTMRTPEQAKAYIVDTATREIIDMYYSQRSTPNLLLFAGCGEYVPLPGNTGNQTSGSTLTLSLLVLLLWLL